VLARGRAKLVARPEGYTKWYLHNAYVGP